MDKVTGRDRDQACTRSNSDTCLFKLRLSNLSRFWRLNNVSLSQMPLPTYLPHLIYATAVTSLSLHLLMQKKGSAERIRQAEARISILQNLAFRLRSGENVTEDEIARSRRMVREGGNDVFEEANRAGGMVKETDVDWKTVMLGRSVKEKEGVEAEFLKVLKDGASRMTFILNIYLDALHQLNSLRYLFKFSMIPLLG